MPKRQEAAAARRRTHNVQQIREAATAAARLWKTCAWLIAEARNADQIEEVTNAVLNLVVRVGAGLPLPAAPHDVAAAIDPNASRVPWYARGATPSDTDRREVA